MKPKTIRAEPVKLSTYFFEQLLPDAYPSEEELKAGKQPSTLPSPLPLPSFDCTQEDLNQEEKHTDSSACSSDVPPKSHFLTPMWKLAPVTKDNRINHLLWEHFSPDVYKKSLISFVSTEHGQAVKLAKELEDMWAQVEAAQARNKARAAVLHSDPDPLQEQLAPVKEQSFWTSEDVLRRYGLDLTLPSALEELTCTKQAATSIRPPAAVETGEPYTHLMSEAHVKLQFDVYGADAVKAASQIESKAEVGSAPSLSSPTSKSSHSNSQSANEIDHSRGAAASLPTKAKAYGKTKEELLDPSQRPYCLRRLFAPLLQKKGMLPKNLTILLSEIQKHQKESLPKLEEVLSDSRMYRIPLYIPFQMLSRYISSHLSHDMPTVALEEQVVKDQKQTEEMKQYLAELHTFILENGSEGQADQLAPTKRVVIAREMWERLLEALNKHHRLHDRWKEHYHEMTRCSAEKMKEIREALERCDQASSEALEQLVAESKECAAVMDEMTSKIKHVVSEMENHYLQDKQSLSASLTSKRYKLQKSEVLQEKLARRVREAVKEYFTEQIHYEEMAQEVFQEQLALAQLEASYEQVRAAVNSWNNEAVEGDRRTASIQWMLKRSEKVRQSMLTSFRQHIGRLETEDYYRRHRVADHCANNMRTWAQCLNDIVGVYEDRFDGISEKGSRSWQLNYLIASERDWALGNFLEGREELTILDRRIEEIKGMYRELDAEVPTLIPDSNAPEAIEIRTAMREIDGPPNVQRNLPRLRPKVLGHQSKKRLEQLLLSTQEPIPCGEGMVGPVREDGPAGGPPNAAGRDGPVLTADEKIKQHVAPGHEGCSVGADANDMPNAMVASEKSSAEPAHLRIGATKGSSSKHIRSQASPADVVTEKESAPAATLQPQPPKLSGKQKPEPVLPPLLFEAPMTAEID